MRFLGVLRVKMWKYCLLTPKRQYPAWIRVCWCIACQNRFNSLSSRSVERFCVQRNKKKLSGNFGYMGRSNPWGDLDQMSLVGRYGGRNHVCNIWWLSVKGCGCGERGKFAFSHWLDASPLQHWSHYSVWPCDRDFEIGVRGHSRSLKLVPFESLAAISYSTSIVTMAVSVSVCEIFSVKEWCDLENRVRVRSKSLEMAPFDRSHTSSYSPSIVTMARFSDLFV